MVARDYAFHCSACGRCCNSSPQLTAPELFRFQHRFIGALTLQRQPRLQPGTPLADGSQLSEAQRHDRASLAERLQLGLANGDTLTLSLCGLDYPSQSRCPALDTAGRCALHQAGKPLTCRTVPLDTWQPESLQSAVLADRGRHVDFVAANCLATEPRPGYAPLLQAGQLVDAGYRSAFEQQQAALADDKRYWGEAVHRLLQPQLAAASLPAPGQLVVAPTLLVLVLAGVSARCRQRCLDFIAAQQALIDDELAAALARRRTDDRPHTQQLRGFLQNYTEVLRTLAQPPAHYRADVDEAARIEHWLGLAPADHLASANLDSPS